MRSIRLVFAACLLSAAPLAAQATATVCKDATTSVSAGRGACSGHGGVDAKASAKAAKAATAAMKKEEAAKKQTAKAEMKVDKAADKASKAADKASKAETKAEKASDKAATTTVACTDGSKSAGGRGACSGHGGIAVSNPMQQKAEKAQTKAAKAEEKSEKVEARPSSGRGEDNNPVGAIAKCKDGMYSHSANRRGACSRHGGVASWT